MRVSPRSRFAALHLVGCMLSLGIASAQAPWKVTVTQTMNPLPIGFCAAVQVSVVDASGTAPRNKEQRRVTIADFDMAVTGASVVGQHLDASHWQVCACQGGSAGTTATVVATYPARALPESSRVEEIEVQATTTFELGAPKGEVNPRACATGAGAPVGIALPPTAPAVSVAAPPEIPPTAQPTNPTPLGAVAGGRTQLRVRPIANVRAGTPFSVTVEAVDSSGAIVPTVNGQILLSVAATGVANLGPGKHNMTGGIATVSGMVLNDAADNYTVTASLGTPGNSAAVSNRFSVTASVLRMDRASYPTTITAGTPFTVVLEAFDASSTLAENFTGSVTLHAAAPAAGDFAAPPTVNAVAGVATFTGLVLGTASGGYVLTASSPGVTSLPGSAFTVLPTASTGLSNTGGRTQLRVRPIANVQAGTPFSVTVEAVDSGGAIVPTVNGQIFLSFAATGGENLGSGKRNMTGGIATVSGMVLNDAADNYTVTASLGTPGNVTAVSNRFSVTASVLRRYTTASYPYNVTAGTPFTVVIKALDASTNVAENFTGSVTLHAAAPAAGDFAAPPTVNAVAGVATFTGLVLGTASGGYVLTASSPGMTSLPDNAFTVSP
jgi:hypothetical protein